MTNAALPLSDCRDLTASGIAEARTGTALPARALVEMLFDPYLPLRRRQREQAIDRLVATLNAERWRILRAGRADADRFERMLRTMAADALDG